VRKERSERALGVVAMEDRFWGAGARHFASGYGFSGALNRDRPALT
jgi:hypothetical protein